MESRREYYFMRDNSWYYHDIGENILKLTDEAPEKAIISYERYLKDIEHDDAVMLGLVSDEEDDAYEEMREKEMEEESNWVKLEQEELSSMKLVGV